MNKFTYLLLLLFCMMGGVMNAQEILGFTKAAEAQTLPANLATGYYLIKEVNSQATGKPGGYLKAASEAANAVVTPQGKDTPYNGENALELWYIEVNGKTFTIATANKRAAWQAPHQGQKNLVAYADKANLTKTTEEISLGNHTAKAQEGSCIIQNEAKSACVHYTNNDLGSWTDANPASVMMFEFYKVEEADIKRRSYTEMIKNTYESTKINTDKAYASYVGYISDNQKSIIDAAKQTALQSPSEESYNKLVKTIKDNSVGFEEGAYYLIENQNTITKKYPSTQHMNCDKEGHYVVADNDRRIRRVTAESPLVARLWKVEKQGNGTYKFRSANTGCVWSSYVDAGIDMPIDKKAGGQYSIEGLPWNAKAEGVDSYNTKFYIKIDGHTINAFSGDTGDLLREYNHADDAGGFWSFKKVTEVPVTIGEAKWASVCMPFAVTLPEGVKAYKATACQNNSMTLTEITGTIPAGTGFLLTGDAKDYMLTIATDEQVSADVSGNLLKGATAKRLGFGEGETFALGKSGNGAVFKKNGLKDANKGNKGYVPANKAYILTTDLNPAAQAAAMLQFNFGDNTTGIDGVEVDNEKDTIYYDLNGRRVLYPTQGVYVTNTGKKVFIR